MLFVAGIAVAHDAAALEKPWLEGISPVADFADRAFARSVWTETANQSDLEKLEARHCAASSVKAMEKQLPKPKAQKAYVEFARAAGETSGDLGKCIDIRAAKEIFAMAYFDARHDASRNKSGYPTQWPPIRESYCSTYLETTPLAERCDDLPDWRSDKQKAQDAERAKRDQQANKD